MSETKQYVVLLGYAAAVAFVFVLVVYLWQNRKDLALIRRPAHRPDIYFGLRDQILRGSRVAFNLAPTQTATEPWGVVMDWGINDGIATVVALSDGRASIYTSSGGGSIGGGQSHESIRKAAQNAVAIAAEVQLQARAATTFPLPIKGEVIFYFPTDSGVFMARGLQSELQTYQHPLAKLGAAMLEILTGYRVMQGGGK
jgi:hypothetical protein